MMRLPGNPPFLAITLHTGHQLLIDAEDWQRVKQHRWGGYDMRGGSSYVRGYISGKNVYLHRLLLEVPLGWEADHINHNSLDNRRSNLRRVTHQQNQCNRRPLSGLSSTFKGVSYDKRNRKWRAAIKRNGILYYLGDFPEEEAAARAYDRAATELHGDFAYLNFPEAIDATA